MQPNYGTNYFFKGQKKGFSAFNNRLFRPFWTKEFRGRVYMAKVSAPLQNYFAENGYPNK